MDLLFSFFFIFTTLLFFHVPTSVLAMDDQYENCGTPFRCGNMDISYPFWGGDRSEYCGYPGFKVECNMDVPQINILDRTYRILDIDRPSRTVTVARQDYWENNCPSNPGNSPLNFSLFQYTSATRNITLYYDCPLSSSNEIMAMFLPNRFYCNSEQTNPNTFNYFIFTNNGFTSASSEYLRSCDTNVQVSVLVSTAERNLPNLTIVVLSCNGMQMTLPVIDVKSRMDYADMTLKLVNSLVIALISLNPLAVHLHDRKMSDSTNLS